MLQTDNIFFSPIFLTGKLPKDNYKETIINMLLCCKRLNIFIPKDIRILLTSHIKIMVLVEKKIYCDRVSYPLNLNHDFAIIDILSEPLITPATICINYIHHCGIGINKYLFYLPDLRLLKLSINSTNFSVQYWNFTDHNHELAKALLLLRKGLNLVIRHNTDTSLCVSGTLKIRNGTARLSVDKNNESRNIEIRKAIDTCLKYDVVTLENIYDVDTRLFYDEHGNGFSSNLTNIK